jgi:hypothetical protein
MGHLPHPDRDLAGIYFHDADYRLSGHGAPGASLRVLVTSNFRQLT